MNTAYLVAGLAYGDEGKGATTDFLCRSRQVSHVVRYNGGPQTAHNVITPTDKHHTFSLFGSGTLHGAKTYLTRFVSINPVAIEYEANHLKLLGVENPYELLQIDYRCPVVTPFHRAINRIDQWLRDVNTSCGIGFGECKADYLKYRTRVLFAGDLRDPVVTHDKLKFLQSVALEKLKLLPVSADEVVQQEILELQDPKRPLEIALRYGELLLPVVYISGARVLLTGESDVVFEGAQGVLLDETHGEEGFNTWSNTTFDNAYSILEDVAWAGKIQRIGVLRTYATRHGDGPFPTEYLPPDSPLNIYELHNENRGFAGTFRTGAFDGDAIKRSLKICGGVDGFALNHLDVVPDFDVEELEFETNTPVWIVGRGAKAKHRSWRQPGL